ncbi:hypothetical protein AGIG_G24825 [Arapaima gigas]
MAAQPAPEHSNAVRTRKSSNPPTRRPLQRPLAERLISGELLLRDRELGECSKLQDRLSGTGSGFQGIPAGGVSQVCDAGDTSHIRGPDANAHESSSQCRQ